MLKEKLELLQTAKWTITLHEVQPVKDEYYSSAMNIC